MFPLMGTPIGYAKAIADYDLTVLPPHQLSCCAAVAGKQVQSKDGREFVTYPNAYNPGPLLCDHLEFALKHEGVSLEVLAALFRAVEQQSFETALCRHIEARPTGRNTRRLWFLYEFLTKRRLPLEDVTQGNYVELLDPKRYYTAAPVNSRRHRVRDNLLGNVKFCPMVRRTPTLREFETKQLKKEAARIVASYDEETLRRAVDYLYTKETRSSFDIEREKPSQSPSFTRPPSPLVSSSSTPSKMATAGSTGCSSTTSSPGRASPPRVSSFPSPRSCCRSGRSTTPASSPSPSR